MADDREELRRIHKNLAERALLKRAALAIGQRRGWRGHERTQVANLIHMLLEDKPRLHYGYLDHKHVTEEVGFDPAAA